MPSPCHLALFKHHDSKSNWPSLKGPHVFWCWFGNWRAGLTADPLLSHGISCAFLFQIMEKVGSGDKLSHHLPDVYYYVRKKVDHHLTLFISSMVFRPTSHRKGYHTHHSMFSGCLGCIYSLSAECRAVITTDKLFCSIYSKFAIVLWGQCLC